MFNDDFFLRIHIYNYFQALKNKTENFLYKILSLFIYFFRIWNWLIKKFDFSS